MEGIISTPAAVFIQRPSVRNCSIQSFRTAAECATLPRTFCGGASNVLPWYFPFVPCVHAMKSISRRAFLGGAGGTLATMASVHGTVASDAVSPVHPARVNLKGADFLDAFDLDPQLTYLNNGSLGPTPASVREVVRQVEERIETNPVGMNWGPVAEQADAARARASGFLGCDFDELAVTRNATEAMSAVAEGVHLQAEERVLTTDQEHPGGTVGWEHEARHRGVIIDRLRLPEEPVAEAGFMAALEALLTPRTRVISLSHVTYTDGWRLPIRAVARMAEARGLLLVVDGAQATGVIPVDLHALGCHAYATSAHKWLLAPKGTGLLYVRRDARAKIRPLLLHGGMATYTATTGTRNLAGIVGLGAAVAWLETLGMTRVQAHVRILRERLFRWLEHRRQGVPGMHVIGPRRADEAAGLVTIVLPRCYSAAEVVRRLRRDHAVIVRSVATATREAVRVSFHVYNNVSDVDRLTVGLDRVVQEIQDEKKRD